MDWKTDQIEGGGSTNKDDVWPPTKQGHTLEWPILILNKAIHQQIILSVFLLVDQERVADNIGPQSG